LFFDAERYDLSGWPRENECASGSEYSRRSVRILCKEDILAMLRYLHGLKMVAAKSMISITSATAVFVRWAS
jgi:hypothetical protein